MSQTNQRFQMNQKYQTNQRNRRNQTFRRYHYLPVDLEPLLTQG
jgi:hypothetical protein